MCRLHDSLVARERPLGPQSIEHFMAPQARPVR